MNDSFDREATVTTPEHVQLQFVTAGLGSRSAAQLVDLAVMSVLYGLVLLIFGLLGTVTPLGLQDIVDEYSAAFLILFAFLLFGGYFALLEFYMNGQTIGKRALGLRVIQENGQSVTFLSAMIRNFFRLIDFLPSLYFVGSLWMFFHSKDKRLGDVAAGTLVVRDTRRERQQAKEKAREWLAKWGEARPELELSPLAKKSVERDDWLLLSALVERFPTLDPQVREKLGAAVAERLAVRLGLDQQLYEGRPAPFLAALYEQLSEEWAI